MYICTHNNRDRIYKKNVKNENKLYAIKDFSGTTVQ